MLVETPVELLALARRQFFDTVTPYLFSDDDLYYCMDLAQKAFARETKCISDATTFTGLEVEADYEYVPYDESIIDIKRARLVTAKRSLEVKNYEAMTDGYIKDDYGIRTTNSDVWETDTGTPSMLILNETTDQMRLYPIPTEADTLNLVVWREPLSDIESSTSTLEIPKRYRHYLIHYIAAYVYSRPDFETYDAGKYAEEMIKWQLAVNTAQAEVKRKTRRPRPVKYGGL